MKNKLDEIIREVIFIISKTSAFPVSNPLLIIWETNIPKSNVEIANKINNVILLNFIIFCFLNYPHASPQPAQANNHPATTKPVANPKLPTSTVANAAKATTNAAVAIAQDFVIFDWE